MLLCFFVNIAYAIPPINLNPDQCINASITEDSITTNVTICSSGRCVIDQNITCGDYPLNITTDVCDITVFSESVPCEFTTNCSCSYPDVACVPEIHNYSHNYTYETDCADICNLTENMLVICDCEDVDITGQVEKVVCPNVTCQECPEPCKDCPALPTDRIIAKIDEVKVAVSQISTGGGEAGEFPIWLIVIIVIIIAVVIIIIWWFSTREEEPPDVPPHLRHQ